MWPWPRGAFSENKQILGCKLLFSSKGNILPCNYKRMVTVFVLSSIISLVHHKLSNTFGICVWDTHLWICQDSFIQCLQRNIYSHHSCTSDLLKLHLCFRHLLNVSSNHLGQIFYSSTTPVTRSVQEQQVSHSCNLRTTVQVQS